MSELAVSLKRNRLVCVLGLPGDRRNEDIHEAARIVGKNFDRVILRDDFDLRGREPGEVAGVLREGLIAGGLDAEKISHRHAEFDAISLAVAEACAGDLIVYIADKPVIAAQYVETLRKQNDHADH
jgi:cyanophycin synthetase